METPLDAGDALYTLYDNSIIQAYTRQAFHVSGGQLNPGTSSTEITVAVEAGEGRINETDVTWASEEVVLADAGVGPSGSDENQPRVDVVFATQSGALSVATGEPSPYAPDTDANGNPLTPAPFEHWEPSPDDGTNVGGLVLGLVLVKPNWTSAQDMTAADIKQWKLSGTGQLPSVLESDLDANDFNVNNLNALGFAPDGQQNIDFFSTAGEFEVRDMSPSPPETPFSVEANDIHIRRKLNAHGEQIVNPSWLNYQDGSGDANIALMDDGTQSPTVYRLQSRIGGQQNRVLEVLDADNLSSLFSVDTTGVGKLLNGNIGGGTPEKIATEQWAHEQFFEGANGFLDLDQKSADPVPPPSGQVRLYESQGRIEAKWPDGSTAVLGQK